MGPTRSRCATLLNNERQSMPFILALYPFPITNYLHAHTLLPFFACRASQTDWVEIALCQTDFSVNARNWFQTASKSIWHARVTLTHAHTHARAHAQTHTHTHARTHTYTHTHTQWEERRLTEPHLPYLICVYACKCRSISYW